MIPKSIGYKIYWAGRYLERIENVCRASLFALHNGKSLDSLAKEYGLENEKDLMKYIKTSFEYLREDIRGFADERILIEVNSLGLQINSNTSDLESYFSRLLIVINSIGSMLENYFIKTKEEMRIRSQEENAPEF
ncbi:alpha-E domain-containing protein [Sulfurisphaera javensis]|uniref:Alpha-E domain-containing protein n=1 Tax=Sulfurisphaera javensis TaxID=2049879 RepID=A0AAT9GUT8_9CREN